jgi:hypothetical protein
MPPLRAPPAGDPRPTINDEKVVRAAVDRNSEALTTWARKRDYPETAEEVLAILTEAMVASDGIASRAITFLETVFFWVTDANLERHLSVVQKNIQPGFKFFVLEWIIRTGIRFPAKLGDYVDFYSNGYHYAGRVVEIKPDFAAALIESDDGTQIVFAEQVTANRTTLLLNRP